MHRKSMILATVVAAACATKPAPQPAAATAPQPAPKAVSAAGLQDASGQTMEAAVEVPGTVTDDGFAWENDWIYDRFGRFRRIGGGMGQWQGHRYDMVKIELADHSEKTLYFDITEAWKNWKPPAKKQ